MSRSDQDRAFEQWVGTISRNPEAPGDDAGTVSARWAEWLRAFFDAHGPVDREVVTLAAIEHQTALAKDAVARVLRDLHRTTKARPVVEVDVWKETTIRITVDGVYETPSMSEVRPNEAVAEVADYLQAQLIERPVPGVWPVCAVHGFGLHAEMHEGVAVWRCHPGRHSVATIGVLGLRP